MFHLLAEQNAPVGRRREVSWRKIVSPAIPWRTCWRKEIHLHREGKRSVNGGQLALAIVGQVLKRLPHEVLVRVLQQTLGQELQRVLQHLVELVLVEELLQGADQVDHVLVAILR